VFAWFFNLLPYMAVNRSSFVYHYMPGLLNAEIMTALLLDRFCGRYRKHVMGTLLVIVIVTFIYFAPWIYALPINEASKNARVWYEGWK
jgi:dolichyl-phosphate-mannose--protein O-mannosyl transferase